MFIIIIKESIQTNKLIPDCLFCEGVGYYMFHMHALIYQQCST